MNSKKVKDVMRLFYTFVDPGIIYLEAEMAMKKKKDLNFEEFETSINVLHGLVEEAKEKGNCNIDYSGDLSMALHRNGFIGPIHFQKFYELLSSESEQNIDDAFVSYHYRYCYIYEQLRGFSYDDKVVNEIIKWFCYDNDKSEYKKSRANLRMLAHVAMVYSQIYKRYGIDADLKNWSRAAERRFSDRGVEKEIRIIED